MYRVFLVSVSVLALAGCLGGGSSSDDDPPTVGPGNGSGDAGGGGNGGGDTGGGTGIGADNQPFTVTGQAVTTKFTGNGAGDVNGLGAFSGPVDLTINGSADTTGDGPDTIDFVTENGTVTFNNTSRDYEETVLNGRVLDEGDTDGTLLITTVDDDFEYTAFGIWTQFDGPDADPAPGDRLDVGAVGEVTETLPGGSATYTGQSVGVESDGTDLRLTTSDISITTDFSDITVVSSSTLAQSTEDIDNAPVVSASNLDFTATGSVTGTGYAAAGGGMQVNGAFHGPNAEETGGVFHGTVGGSNYGGAFGAKQ